MRKQLLLLLCLSLLSLPGLARVVTGVVTQSSDGEPIIGASVKVHGTSRGTATDFEGRFSIEASDGDVLDVSYVGMNPKSVKIAPGQTEVNIALDENSQVLGEVVVTAMGQTQEKKKLNFAVQTLDEEAVTAGGSTNFANTLQGKVAGLQVSTGGSSPNSSTQIIIRAISSMNNSMGNEPLIIIDGMAIRGGATTLADMNPNDIDNITVLKGAAASALYGQEAANGVIMVTTKSGGKGGEINVSASATIELNTPYRLPKIQSTFIPGAKGMYKENMGSGGWGPYMGVNDRYYNNLKEFLKTGVLQKYDVSVSGGSEKFSSYASASYTNNQGIVPKDYRKQVNVLLKGIYKPSDKVTIQLSANFMNRKSRGFGNSMSTIYNWGINKDMSDYRTLEGHVNWWAYYDHWENLLDTERINGAVSPYFGRYMDWSQTESNRFIINGAVSPYFGRYMDWSQTESNRFIINGQISYEPIKNLVFTGKMGYDKSYSMYDSYTVPRIYEGDLVDPTAEDVQTKLSDMQSKFGSYSFQPSRGSLLNMQLLATYAHTFAQDYTVSALYGLEYKENRGVEASIYNEHFQLGGEFYSFNNTDFTNGDLLISNHPTLYHSKRNIYGHFGELRFDYKGMAQISATARMDGSSTLRQSTQTTFFYPSVTAGVIFSELFNLSNDWFSYGKLRGNWAKVGKDCQAFLFTDTYKQWTLFPDGGYGVDPTTSRAVDLIPEMTKSWEIGADLRFFRNWTRLDIAYYSTTVDNQIVTVRVSPASGVILQTRNEGSLKNHGMEISLNQDIIKANDFSWTALANFSFNRSKVLYLPNELTEIQGTQYGDIFPVARLHESSTGISGKDYVRDPEGRVVCDENGYPIIDAAKGLYIGNREPDWLLGIGSTLRYKNATLSFLFDGRKGGDVVNVTGRSQITNGMSSLYDKYRNREYIIDGVQAVAAPDGTTTYVKNTTPIVLDSYFINTYYSTVSSNFIEDGSYIRLSYVTLSYDIGKHFKRTWPVKGLSLTATARNLFLLTKYRGNDPAVLAGTGGGTGSAGIDNYNVPSTRSFNFTLKATF